jgi:hypothetical protein
MSFKFNVALTLILIPITVSAETLQEKFDAFAKKHQISQQDLQELMSKEREALAKQYRASATRLLLKTAVDKQSAYLSKQGFQIVHIVSEPSTSLSGKHLVWGNVANIENHLRLCALAGSFYEASSMKAIERRNVTTGVDIASGILNK